MAQVAKLVMQMNYGNKDHLVGALIIAGQIRSSPHHHAVTMSGAAGGLQC
jgi:hypothetical protein